MTQDNPFAFDPAKLGEMMKSADFSKYFNVKGFEGDALIEAQKKNMAALVEANQAAASKYQAMFQSQLASFQANIAKAQSQIQEMKVPESGDVEKQADIVRKSVEESIAQMQTFGDKAKAANTEAYEIIAARVRSSMEEMQEMADKLKG